MVATDNVPVISSRPCMVSAADKSAMQQRHSDVPFTEIWAAAGTMILPGYVFAEEKLFCGRIVRVPHLSVKIAKWMPWTGFFLDKMSITYRGSGSYLSELRFSLPIFNLTHLCRFHSGFFLEFL